jgi:beta propeller repeat protein
MANMRRQRLLLGILLLGLLGTQASALVGYETQITKGSSWHTWPTISGDLVAYEDDQGGHVNIYLYDIRSGITKNLTTGPFEHYWPKIYGDRVVWWDNRSGPHDFNVFMYNVTTGVESQITFDQSNQENAEVYKNLIVWMDKRSGNFDIYLNDTRTGTETPLITTDTEQWEPQIWGSRIIWMDGYGSPDGSSGDFNYYTYDLSTRTPQSLTTEGNAWYGGIHGDRCVWSQYRPSTGNYNEQIYLHDFLNGDTKRITPVGPFESADHWYPKVNDNRVVWEDDRNGRFSNYDIFLYNITSDTEEQVTTLTSVQWNPVVWGNRIVYENYTDGNPQISLYTITREQHPNITANVTAGYAPLAVQFTDLTTEPATTPLWDFGDGSLQISDPTPVHTYANPGTYNVSLRVNFASGTGTLMKSGYISVGQSIIPLPGYSVPPTDVDADGKYEDMDGNGNLRFIDVKIFFDDMEWIAANEPIPPFDMNGNTRIDFADVKTVFNKL